MTMFTSCCPAWVRFSQIPVSDKADHLSTVQNLHKQRCPVRGLKSIPARKIGADPGKEIYVVFPVCPGVSKNGATLPDIIERQRRRRCGHVISLTTREFARLVRTEHIAPALLPRRPLIPQLGSTGAGVIFGVTGGVWKRP